MALVEPLRRAFLKYASHRLPAAVRDPILTRVPRSYHNGVQWIREVCWADMRATFESLDPPKVHVAEVSGDIWGDMPWASRTVFHYPELDLCRPPEAVSTFDLVICEQVLEHVVNPIQAVETLRRMCKPGGHVLVATPFLVRLHNDPGDYWRFTPAGMEVLLRSQGLEPVWVRSWGNQKAVVANFGDWWVARWPWQSLHDDPRLPVVVWALARRS